MGPRRKQTSGSTHKHKKQALQAYSNAIHAEHVLSKYKQNTCPAGCGSEETTEHVLKCKLSNIERYKAVAEIQNLVKAATKCDPEIEQRKRSAEPDNEEFEMKSTEKIIDHWFEDYLDWQGKWASGWDTASKNDLANRLEAITWNEGHNTISIIKKNTDNNYGDSSRRLE